MLAQSVAQFAVSQDDEVPWIAGSGLSTGKLTRLVLVTDVGIYHAKHVIGADGAAIGDGGQDGIGVI